MNQSVHDGTEGKGMARRVSTALGEATAHDAHRTANRRDRVQQRVQGEASLSGAARVRECGRVEHVQVDVYVCYAGTVEGELQPAAQGRLWVGCE